MIEKECLKALDCLYDEDVFDKEVWGFVMEGDNLSCADVERAKKYYRDKIYNLIKEHFSPQPYKFEELKKGMLVWDDENEMFILITFIDKQFKKMHVCLTEYDGFNDEYVNVEYTEYFEEGRFFPITKALEYQE